MGDQNGNNQLESVEFVQVCADIGYPGNPEEALQLYRQLLKDPSRQFLTLDDISVGGVVVRAVTGLTLAMKDDDLLSHDDRAKREMHRRSETLNQAKNQIGAQGVPE